MTKLRIVAGPYEFEAEAEEQAPTTLARFVALLPYRQQIIHVRWSGEGCWIPLGDYDFGLAYENHTSYPAPGDIILYPGGIQRDGDPSGLWRRLLRQQGRATRRQPFSHHHQRP